MLNYYRSIEVKIGKVSEFKDIISELCKDRNLVTDPVQSDTLKTIFPSQFAHKEHSLFLWKEVDDYTPIYNESHNHIIAKAMKTEITIKLNAVYRKDYVLEIFQTVHFVCGFIDHKNIALQTWRTIS